MVNFACAIAALAQSLRLAFPAESARIECCVMLWLIASTTHGYFVVGRRRFESKRKDWLASAALEAHRAEVLAVGILTEGNTTPHLFHGLSEIEILTLAIELTECANFKKTIGHNILGFDIPFLCRRMWKHRIHPPPHWLNCSPYKAGDWAFDTMLAWSCGNRDQRISLDMLAWHLGVGRKTGSGKDFAATYRTNPKAALDYLTNDLILTEKCYLKMR